MSRAGTDDGLDWPRWVLWAIALVPPLVWAALLAYSQVNVEVFTALTTEDGVVENAQALLIGIASWLSLLIAVRLRRAGSWTWALLYGVLALGLFWVAAEEISWGQRVFHWHTPAWLEARNQQQEINLHNLPEVRHLTDTWFIRGVMLIIGLSSLSWLLGGRRAQRWRTALWIPHPVLLPTWVSVWSYEWLRTWYVQRYHAMEVSRVVARLHEGRELIFAIGAAACLALILRQLRHLERAGTRPGGRS